MKNIQEQVVILQAEYIQKMQELVQAQKWHELSEITEAFHARVRELSEFTEAVLPNLSLLPPESKYYRAQTCDISLEAIVYDDDRKYFEEFMSHDLIKQVSNDLEGAATHAKRELLKHTMRLSSSMAPQVFQAIERCRQKLGLKSQIDIYVAQNPTMNAYCYPSHEGCIYLLLTSSLLEKLNEDELTFVIGHEIGHYLFQHNLLTPQHVTNILGEQLSPADVIKLFAWARNAELSADRIGLICCGSFQAACTANFKLSSGIASDALSFSLEEYVRQYQDMEKDLAKHQSLDDYYSTHPLNPMRVIALEQFSRSETYSQFCSEIIAELTEREMEEKIAGFMKLLEPNYLNSPDEVSRLIKEFIFLAAISVASVDGVISQEEMDQISHLLSGENVATQIDQARSWSIEMMLDSTAEHAQKLLPFISPVTSCNIIRDLVIVSLVDGEFTEPEYHVLASICAMLNIHPTFIDQVISSIACQNAA